MSIDLLWETVSRCRDGRARLTSFEGYHLENGYLCLRSKHFSHFTCNLTDRERRLPRSLTFPFDARSTLCAPPPLSLSLISYFFYAIDLRLISLSPLQQTFNPSTALYSSSINDLRDLIYRLQLALISIAVA